MSIPSQRANASSILDDAQRTDRRHDSVSGARILRILLADDSAVARIFAARLLEFSGHAVDLVTDGRQAVNAARSTAYDMILMDVHMPEMDGIQATIALRAGGCTLPILALSGTAVEEEFAGCLDAGMNGRLDKPFTLDAFERECRRIFGRDGDRDASIR